MAEERKDLPAATSDNFAARARETLMTYLGRQGDPLDRGITLRDLVEGGIVAVREGFSLGGRGKLPIQPAPSLGAGGGTDEEKDPTPPPTPTGLTVAAGITNLIIEHDAPLYSQGHGHARTLVYGAKGGTGTPPVFADAVKIHEFTGTVSAYVTDPATTWHLWIKWVSVDGFASALPGGGINGVSATTGQDPAKVLQMLTGQITESQLYADLGERIDLIDGNGAGSVNARIETETTARNAADSSLAQQITTVQAVLTQSNLGKPLPLWNLNGQSIVTLTDGKVGSAALRLSGSAGHYPSQGYLVPIDRSKQYRTRFWARPSADAAGLLYFSLRQYLNESRDLGPVNGGRSPYKPSGVSKSQHDSNYGAGQWGEYSFVWSSSDWQAGVAFVEPDFLDNYSGATGYWDVQDFTFTEVTAIENLSASVQTEATAQANTNGVLLAKYTVKVDVNGYVSGFGLASEANNAAPTSTFAVRADTFYIASPSGPGVTPALPFIVKTTAGAWGPAGVYIQEALIANATIGSAKIADAAIDDAKVANLSAAKLTAGDGTIGGLLKSSNYVVGSAGWMIHPNGTAEFAAAAIRGQLVASQIDSRGLSIKDGSGNVILAAGTPLAASNITPSASWLNGNITLGANGALSGGGGGQVTLPGMGVNTFRILTRGNSSTQHPAGDAGLYKNGAIQSGVSRSYMVGKVSRATGDYTQVGAYDVYGGAGDAAATALNAIGSDFIVVVYSYDEPQNGRSAVFLNAMYRHGASRAVLGSPNFRYRSAYALIGIGGCGEGNGAEIYQGAINDDPAAWIDVGFSVVNGVLTGVSSATTPKSLSDYGYVGDLNATANQPDSTVNAGIASAALTAIWTGVSGAGKPQDNATVGATIGTNLVGQFTPDNSSTYIADAAIKSAHIENLAVNSAKINDLAVTAAKIADLAVTSAKIADASIISAKITDAAIDTAKIGDAAVSTLKIAGNAVSASSFAAGTSLTITVPTGGADVLLTGFINSGSAASGSGYVPTASCRLAVNGANVVSGYLNSAGVYDASGGYGEWVNIFGSSTLSYKAFLPAGAHTITVGASVGISSATIAALIMKR